MSRRDPPAGALAAVTVILLVTAGCSGGGGGSAAPHGDSAPVQPTSESSPRPPTESTTQASPPPTTEPSPPPTQDADPPERAVTVTVVGDMMLGRAVADVAHAAGDPSAPLRPMAGRLARADITVGNLESTLSTSGPPRQGDDSFAASPAVLRGLRAAGFDVLGLANNHTGDYGRPALVETVRRVRTAGIAPLGAGRDRSAAWRPVVVSRAGTRVGFVAFNAIGETYRPKAFSPGAASLRMAPRTGPLRPAELRRLQARVRALAARTDAVVVLPHWGDQYTHQPMPDQRRVGRALLDAGATVVVGGHPHWCRTSNGTGADSSCTRWATSSSTWTS